MDDSIDIFSYIKGLARRIWLILIIFVAGSFVAAAVAYVLPPVFASTARILVESQQIPSDMAKTTVRQSVAERLEEIRQRLLTRSNLLSIIDRFGLFADRDDMTLSEKVDRVRSSTTFESISFDIGSRRRDQSGVAGFTISYTATNAQLAARVANELVTMVLEQNLASRSRRASETSEFFRQEVDRLSRQLLDLEAQIAKFKDENEAALPDSYEFRLSQVAALQERQFEGEKRRIGLEEQRRNLQRAIENGFETDAPQTPDEIQLAKLRQLLVQKRSTFAPTHPEVVALEASIAALETSLAAKPTAVAADDQPVDTTSATARLTSARAQAQLELMDRELALIAEQRTATDKQIKALEVSLARTPQVELQLNAFQRKYENLQTQYQSAVLKLAEAETGNRLEVNRQAERFEVIEQAQVPSQPIAPKRMAIAAGGSGFSLMLGLAMAFMLEITNPAIRTGRDLERRLQLRPVVTVPYLRTRGERRRRLAKWLIQIVLLVAGVAVALWAIDQYVLPLEALWSRALERSGLADIIRAIQARLA